MSVGNVFDPSLAEHPLRTLPVEEIVDLLHVSHWPERVNDYHHAMQAGERFPPVAIVCIARRAFLADGHKRFHAYLQLQPTEIIVQVWPLRRWMADQLGQLKRSVQRWGMAARNLGQPNRHPETAAVVSQAVRHWKRILRSLLARPRAVVSGTEDGNTRRLDR